MDENEYELFKKLAALETENANLKNQMEKLSRESTSSQINEVYEAAKKRMYTWVAGISVVFTLFGFVSISNIVAEIKDDVTQNGGTKIIENIVDRFEKKYSTKIVENITQRVQPGIEEKIVGITNELKESTNELVSSSVERNVRERLLATFKNAEKSQTSSSFKYVEAVEKTYEDKVYWVIAASSVRRRDVVNELDRVRAKVGPDFSEMFPNAQVTAPYAGTTHYPLVLGTGLPYKAAMALRNKAIKAGFRDDTFLWKVKAF